MCAPKFSRPSVKRAITCDCVCQWLGVIGGGGFGASSAFGVASSTVISPASAGRKKVAGPSADADAWPFTRASSPAGIPAMLRRFTEALPSLSFSGIMNCRTPRVMRCRVTGVFPSACVSSA